MTVASPSVLEKLVCHLMIFAPSSIEIEEHCRNFLGETMSNEVKADDPVNHPSHYTSHPSGIECITVTEHMSFNLGNAVKYIWRAGDKGDLVQDLEKAAWYINREIIRVKANA